MEAKPSDESEKRDDEFKAFFDIVTPAAERKRELGQQVRVAPERRQNAGRWAAAARSQLRRTALPPLVATELEPGATVELLIKAAHPLTVPLELPVEVAETIALAANEPEEFKRQRARALTYWEGRANALRETSLLEIANIDDDELRRLHLKTHASSPPLGGFTQLALMRELHEAVGSPDVSFIEGLKHGFTIAMRSITADLEALAGLIDQGSLKTKNTQSFNLADTPLHSPDTLTPRSTLLAHRAWKA